jgi:hypothetical protein
MNDFHRPTYTFPYGAYNATEVRLYGKPGIMDTPAEIRIGDERYEIDFVLRRVGQEEKASETSDDENKKELLEELKHGSTPLSLSALAKWRIPRFNLDLTSLFLLDSTGLEQLVMLASGVITMDGKKPPTLKPVSWGVIYGYAYEGHCYDLLKPKVMLLPVEPQGLPVNDAGYYEKRDANYKVWVVDKLSQCVEIEVNRGFVEQLVLEANLPGKRSPTMYGGRMMLGHKSGRLTE